MQNHDTAVSSLNSLNRRLKPYIVPTATGAATITAAQAKHAGGAIVHNNGAVAARTISLPAAKKGMRVTAFVKAAQELRLDPNGTETMALPSTGVQAAAGKYMTADAIGESGVWICLIDGTWDYLGPIDGTWTAEP